MESGLLSLLDLPFVKQFAAAAPDLVNALSRESDPLGTKEKLQKIQIPTCIFHGNHDDIVPVSQAITAHQICASEDKKLVRVPAGHNDLRSRAYREYYKELKIVCQDKWPLTRRGNTRQYECSKFTCLGLELSTGHEPMLQQKERIHLKLSLCTSLQTCPLHAPVPVNF